MDSNSTDVSELWDGVKNGNKKALSDLYRMYADTLYEFGSSYTSDNQLVEDGIHDLFLELYKRRKKLPVARNVKNYLFTILRRKITELSKSRLLIISPEDDHTNKIYRGRTASVEAEIIHNEERKQLAQSFSNALGLLTPKQRKGVSMRFYENRSYEEMALDLDISIATARTLIYRSLKILRKNMP